MTPKAKLILNASLTVISAGAWLPVWAAWYFIDKSKKSQGAVEDTKNLELDIYDLQGSIKHHEAIEKSLTKLDFKLPKSGTVLNIPLVRLYESRQGESTTETTGTLKATTKTGTVGIGTKIGGLGIGVAASQGETRGTINSKSVTRSGKDEMTLIDNGTLVLKVNSLSLTGNQFSRSVDFEDFLSCRLTRNELVISSTTSEKNWLLAVNSDEAAEIIEQLVSFLSEAPSGKDFAEQGTQTLKNASILNQKALSKYRSEIAVLENKLSEIQSNRTAIN